MNDLELVQRLEDMLLDTMKKRIDELEEENEQIRCELYDSINGNLGNIKAGKL